MLYNALYVKYVYNQLFTGYKTNTRKIKPYLNENEIKEIKKTYGISKDPTVSIINVLKYWNKQI